MSHLKLFNKYIDVTGVLGKGWFLPVRQRPGMSQRSDCLKHFENSCFYRYQRRIASCGEFVLTTAPAMSAAEAPMRVL